SNEGESMKGMCGRIAAFGVALSVVSTALPPAQAAGPSAAPADHVLLISIAGMHDFDLTRFIAAHPDSALAKLRARSALYTQALAPRPSDSFPGMIALVTGALPKQTGVFYDDTWDRALSPAGSDCTKTG